MEFEHRNRVPFACLHASEAPVPEPTTSMNAGMAPAQTMDILFSG
jgi:hypothetical protein